MNNTQVVEEPLVNLKKNIAKQLFTPSEIDENRILYGDCVIVESLSQLMGLYQFIKPSAFENMKKYSISSGHVASTIAVMESIVSMVYNTKQEHNVMDSIQGDVNPVIFNAANRYGRYNAQPVNTKISVMKQKIHRLLKKNNDPRAEFMNYMANNYRLNFSTVQKINNVDALFINIEQTSHLLPVGFSAWFVPRNQINDFMIGFNEYMFTIITEIKTFIEDLVENNETDLSVRTIRTFYLNVENNDNERQTSSMRMPPQMFSGYPPMKPYGAANWLQNNKDLNGRPFSSIYIPKADIESLRIDIDEFYDDETVAFYKQHNIPRKRIYLFHGIPGTGKSSLIKSIATQYNLDLSVLKMTSRDMNDTILRDAFSSIPGNSILVIEEVDTLFANVTITDDDKTGNSVKYRQNTMRNDLTFGGLLDMIDGMTEVSEQIIIMTTNHMDRLDPAQLRPGRVDFAIEFKHMIREQVLQMTRAFYKKETEELVSAFADAFLERFKEVTPAYLQGLFVFYRKISLAELTELIRNNKIDHRISITTSSLSAQNNNNVNSLFC